MQEYSFPVTPGLAGGIVPDNMFPPGVGYASVMRNLRPEPFAATSPELISNPMRASQDWPFPKAVRDERVTLLLSRTGISTLAEGSPTWTPSSVTLKSSHTQATTVTLTGGTHWDFCAFEDGHWFATNGVDFAFKLSTYSPTLKGYFDASTNALACACLCRSGERLFLGGLSGGTWFTDTRWQALFDLWRMKQRNLMHSAMTWDAKWVVWGERRGGAPDGPFFLLMCALGLFGTTVYDTFEPEIRAAVEKGEIGFASVKDVGVPRQMKELSGSVKVYGPSVTATLSPTEGPGYAVSYERGRGIRNFALSGDESEHAMIDPSGDLYHSRHGLLGFRWIFQSTPPSTTWATPVMSYDPARREHWISNGTDTYVLMPSGALGGPMTFLPTGLFRTDSQLIGVTQYNAGSGAEAIAGTAIPTGTTWTAEFQSHVNSMNYRGSKRVQVIEATLENITSLLGDVHARTGSAGTYTSMGTVQFNSDGACYPTRSGNDFKITVKGTVNAGARYAINGIICRYQAEARTHRRGTSQPIAES